MALEFSIFTAVSDMATGTLFDDPDVADQPPLEIPASAFTPGGFRDWSFSASFPEGVRATLVGGNILIDMNSERFNTHNFVKLEVTSVIYMLAKSQHLGMTAADGALITNEAIGLSNEPDGCFVSWDSLRAKRVRLVRSETGNKAESWEGAPDWVMEVVSDSSVKKDTVILMESYHQAGIREYWVIDARKLDIDFNIYAWQESGYVAQPRTGGWVASPVFGCSFSLQRRMIEEYLNYELRMSANTTSLERTE
ncbi:MAG: Uma2 family endonuclease [Pirellulaceae bacterium]